MIYIGCHLSSSGGYLNMAKEAVKLGADTFQFFTRNPRGGKAKEIDEDDIERFLEAAETHNFGKIIAHAPYTLNPCSAKANVREFAHMTMTDDLRRMEYTPGSYYNFHPGSHVGQGVETGIKQITELLNDILTPEQSTIVLLETMAGKGSEIGSRFEELAAIIDRVDLKDKIGVLLDTCHVSDAGYDIKNDLDAVLSEFDRVIGLDRLKAVHVNDSKNPADSHKDRHEKIGEGYLGTKTFENILNHPKLSGLPFILETPNDLEGYGKEISMLKEMIRNP